MTPCRSCGAELIWCLTPSSRWMPVDREPVADGNVEINYEHQPPLAVVLTSTDLAQARLEKIPLHKTHLSTCPNRLEHKRRAA